MPLNPRSLPLLVALAIAVPFVPGPRARAEDETAPETPPAAAPAELYEQMDRKKTMSIKLPRTWKSVGGGELDPKALAGYAGFYGEENKSPNGFVVLFVENQFARAALARAISMPQVGTVKADSLRQGPGWVEACALNDQHNVVWRRYVEKGNRVYMFQVVAHENAYDAVKATVQKLLDTAAVPGEFVQPPAGDGFASKKSGDYDIVTDAESDRESSVKKATTQLAQARDIVVKALPGKPFDTSKPVAWVFQNGQKFEDRAKAALGIEARFAVFNPVDRCALVSILSDSAMGHDEAIFRAGAAQYVWQYFGGESPIWVSIGMSAYGQYVALGGGKKLVPDVLTKSKAAVAAGKRRLDQWFDVASWNEVTDNQQGTFELFAWHTYFRTGKGAKKFKKQYEGYVQSLRDTGDPAAARKAFDGVNFDEMLQDFKGWAADWK